MIYEEFPTPLISEDINEEFEEEISEDDVLGEEVSEEDEWSEFE